MKRFARGLPSPAMVVAVVALTFALTGGAFAGVSALIDSSDIKDDSIRSQDIKNGVVRSKDIANNKVRSIDIRNGTIQAEDLAPGLVLNGAPGPKGDKGDKGEAGGTVGFHEHELCIADSNGDTNDVVGHGAAACGAAETSITILVKNHPVE